jgi:hypothetical protein
MPPKEWRAKCQLQKWEVLSIPASVQSQISSSMTSERTEKNSWLGSYLTIKWKSHSHSQNRSKTSSGRLLTWRNLTNDQRRRLCRVIKSMRTSSATVRWWEKAT